MDRNFSFSSAGQVHELELAMRNAKCWTTSKVKALSRPDLLVKVSDLVDGFATITPTKHRVDCNTKAFEALLDCHCWTVKMHREQGVVDVWRSGDDVFVGGRRIMPHFVEADSTEEMVSMLVASGIEPVNACIHQFFAGHLNYVPEVWAELPFFNGSMPYIFFMGTIFGGREEVVHSVALVWHDLAKSDTPRHNTKHPFKRWTAGDWQGLDSDQKVARRAVMVFAD